MSYTNKLLMPGDGAINPFTVPGTTRKYTCSAGATILVPDFDAALMLSEGWVNSTGSGSGSAGPTSGRPSAPSVGQIYTDTTVGAAVVYAGAKTGWLHHATGAST